jgi:2-polyprenyl-6-methoxyphenol hydroxylase-like FAD-dependent oxidoreductase
VSFDVAVIGYGPTGMTLAALLGQLGRSVVVLERHTGLYNLPRAACFDDEIMRTFQKLGLVDEIAPGIVAQPDYEWVNAAGETLVHIAYDDGPGGWAALYMMYQPHLETVLDRHCKGLASVQVRQGVLVDGLRAGDDGVEVSGVTRDGARETVRARYVVGADGGGGFTRRALGIGLSDYGFEENWLVCDFRKNGPLDDVPTFRQVCDPAQPIAIVRIGPEHQRFSFMLDRDESAAAATDEQRVWERVARYLEPGDADLIRVANYVFRSRVADRWREGGVLLAGDAAHEMPPFLAQGMCSGIRDSHNLAWKLDLVLGGQAGTELLDTYQPEREPHVRFITEKAIELGRVQTLRDPVAARVRDERLLAQRRARQAPEKVRYPPLTAGLIAPDGGAVFPQGLVEGSDGESLLDDLVGPGPCLVASDAGVLDVLGDRGRERWARLGGRLVHPGGPELRELDGTYEAWFAEHACAAALVRPDWYVYGTARETSAAPGLLERFEGALAAG